MQLSKPSRASYVPSRSSPTASFENTGHEPLIDTVDYDALSERPELAVTREPAEYHACFMSTCRAVLPPTKFQYNTVLTR